MRIDAEQVLCRFQLSNFVRKGMSPLFEWIVHKAHGEGLQGATVLKGFHGLRADGSVLHESNWALSEELPVIVEVVDDARHIEALLRIVEPFFGAGTITLERARVLLYRSRRDTTAVPRRTDSVVETQHMSAAGEVKTMQIHENGVLLRIFIGESDHDKERDLPLYQAIVARAREAHLAGATVLRGPMGFGRHSRVHAAKLLELSTDLPIVIEIVDSEEKINAFLPVVDALVTEGLVTIEAVRVLKYVSPDRR
jgi:PII-like signaling protein